VVAGVVPRKVKTSVAIQMVRGGCFVAAQQIGAPMLEKKQIREVIRTMELAADESEQAAQDGNEMPLPLVCCTGTEPAFCSGICCLMRFLRSGLIEVLGTAVAGGG